MAPRSPPRTAKGPGRLSGVPQGKREHRKDRGQVLRLVFLRRNHRVTPSATARSPNAMPTTSGALSSLGRGAGGTAFDGVDGAADGAADSAEEAGDATGAVEAGAWTVKEYFPSMGCPSEETARHSTV